MFAWMQRLIDRLPWRRHKRRPERPQPQDGQTPAPPPERETVLRWDGVRLHVSGWVLDNARRVYLVLHTPNPLGSRRYTDGSYHELIRQWRPAVSVLDVPVALRHSESVIQFAADFGEPIHLVAIFYPAIHPSESSITETEWRSGKSDDMVMRRGRDG